MLAGLIALFLIAFLVVPVATVILAAFQAKGSGAFTLISFYDFLQNELFRRSFFNSLYVSGMAVVWATVLALPPPTSRRASSSKARS